MRNAFAQEIVALARQDSRVVLLSGDIGNRLFDKFKAEFPDRFYNCGVAEANMTGMAAGMAMAGLRPILYTITPFITTRVLEQIRIDICYHNLPVIIVGVGAGLAYASLGATHQSLEDIACLRLLPHMQVVCPADPVETRLSLRAALASPCPTYLRMGKKGEPTIHSEPPEFVIGTAIRLKAGSKVTLIGTGIILPEVLEAAALLEERGISSAVVDMHTVKPLDEECLRASFAATGLVVTIEEHNRNGGLGGAVAEWFVDQPAPPGRLLRLGTTDEFLHLAGEQEFARHHWGLTAEQIADVASRHL